MDNILYATGGKHQLGKLKKKPTHPLLTRYFEIRLIAMDNIEIPWNVKQKQQIHKYYDDDKTRNMCDMYS